MSLWEFLETKELFYKDIDYDFFPSVWKRVSKKFFYPKVIHVIGTNGKGSTGRFLSYYLHKAGYKVGHYSSPHIIKFNERIWIDGKDASDETLDLCHDRLQKKLDSDTVEKLSYFEYTTLLAIEVFSSCDFIVLEAGLGGEYDATNVFDKLFTIVTPIGIDHESFLGNTLKEIASTKLRSVNTFAIMTEQKEEVFKVADELKINYFKATEFFSKDELEQIKLFIKKSGFASYLAQNLTLAMSAIKKLDLKYDLNYLNGVKLKGRFEKIAPNITIDVGHNKQAATAIKNELKDKKITLVYNTYHDKDFEQILTILKPNIKKVLIIKVDGERVLKEDILKTFLEKEHIPFESFSMQKLDKTDEYLVFGSFVVVEEFLKLLKYEDNLTLTSRLNE